MIQREVMTTPPGTRTGWIETGGSRTRWYQWGSGGPTVLLIHGGGANSSWWFDTVLALGPHQRIVAFDLSGHGDSDPRDEYSITRWSDEAEAVMSSLTGPAVVVAHSMGGRAAVLLAARRPDLVQALVLIDSVLPTHAGEPVPTPSGKRVYPTLEDAISRFRLAPASAEVLPDAVRDRLARASIEQTEGGWTWKFDPSVFTMPDADLVNASIAAISCPVVVIHAAESPVTNPEMVAAFADLLGRPVHFSSLAGAHHHFVAGEPERTARMLGAIGVLAPHSD
jgi:pimeloyl-ACP methyl ester carboxylesterase